MTAEDTSSDFDALGRDDTTPPTSAVEAAAPPLPDKFADDEATPKASALKGRKSNAITAAITAAVTLLVSNTALVPRGTVQDMKDDHADKIEELKGEHKDAIELKDDALVAQTAASTLALTNLGTAKDAEIATLKRQHLAREAETLRTAPANHDPRSATLIVNGQTDSGFLQMPPKKMASMSSSLAITFLSETGDIMENDTLSPITVLSNDPSFVDNNVFAVGEKLLQTRGGPEAVTRAFSAVMTAPSFIDDSTKAIYTATSVLDNAGNRHVQFVEDVGNNGVRVNIGPQVPL